MKKETYHIITYGCQMNKSDSERIASFFEQNNFCENKMEKANFIILNLCSVRQKSLDKVWGKLNGIKKKNPKAKIILTGCILENDKKKFLKKVDYVLNIKDLDHWPIINNCEIKNKNYFSIQPKHNSKSEAFVPIMTGCNNFCSYCVVPYTRGPEKSRSTKKILDEVNKLIVQGYKHIILLGQNVNSYNSQQTTNNKTTKINFPKLLKLIDKIPGNYKLSFMTSHPKDVSNELIKCFKTCEHLSSFLHLPIQSGSDKILKLMNRKYTVKKYLKLINKIRKINPDINLSTDVIVGFPNETKKDFNDTIKLMKEVKFDMAYINQYSPRSGTKAFEMKDNISLEEKKKRDRILTDILKKTALEKNKKMIGTEVEMLVENRKKDYVFGKTKSFKNIKIKTNKNFINKIVKAKITKASAWCLGGKII